MKIGLGNFSNLGITDITICFIILLFSITSHLWCIDYPPRSTFDEVHFGNFTNWYTQSQYFFDIHPPLAKLIMFYFANLSEYQGDIDFVFQNNSKYTNPTYIQLRITPSIISSLCPVLIYLSMRILSFSTLSSLTSSMLALFDTSLLIEGRYILTDGILHFFVCLHLLILFYTSSLSVEDDKFLLWHIFTGLSLGAACSCKNTAWGICFVDSYIYILVFRNYISISFYSYMKKLIQYGISLFLIAVSVYEISFSIHFILLPYAGPGYNYMSKELMDQLILNNFVDDNFDIIRISNPSLLLRALKLSKIMHQDNMKITDSHISASSPSQWPLLTGVDVRFFIGDGELILCQGNVFSYYFGLIGLVMCLFLYKSRNYLTNMIWVVGWCFSYFPFYLIPRVMFLYHYLIPMMLGCSAFGASLDLFPPKLKGITASCAIILSAFGFWLWVPLVTGKYRRDNEIMFWNPKWLNMTMNLSNLTI